MKNKLIGGLLALAALLLLPVAALAQFAPTPAPGVITNSYRASVTGLATAASATDFFTITGASGKVVTVQRIACSGIASTAGTPDIVLLRRSAANSAGTSTTPTVVKLDTTSPNASAVVRAYTANPTLGALVGNLDVAKLALPLAATGANMQIYVYVNMSGSIPLRVRSGEVVALNGNAATLAPGASLDCSIEWTER